MTKLESIEHKIFASEAPLDEIGQFGSALDTTKLNTKDVTTIQALPAYTKGWGSAVISDSNYPTMEEMNGVLNVMSYHTGYLYQEGMPAWRNDREYSATSIVKEPTGTKFFHSLKDGNIGNTLDNTEYWEELKFGGSGLEICDIGMSLYVDETKGLRRYLNGQIVDINTNTKAFLNRLKEITTLHPSLLCTEEEWQTAKTMSAFGQVGKFVFNYSGDDIVSVRLPRVVNVQGLFDLQNLGMTVGAGLPNITGTVSTDRARFSNADGAFAILNTGAKETGSVGTGNASFTLDASRSNQIYGNSNTVQPEAIQYPYFIQIATGQETENNIINEIELNNPYSLFDSKYSDHELNNLSWLKSEGQWNAKAVYPSAYDELLREYNNPDRLAIFNRDAFEVVGSPTITDDGIASRFSGSDYLTTTSYWTPNSYPWVITCCFITGDNVNTRQKIWGGSGVDFKVPSVSFRDGKWSVAIPNSEGTEWQKELFNIDKILPNTKYIVKLYFTGSEYKLDYSLDGLNWKNIFQYVSTTPVYNANCVITIGGDNIGGGPNFVFNGSIDLKHFSITVDGVKVFSGAKPKVKLSTEEYTDYDFVLNTADETFRLPLKTKLASGKAVVGNGYTMGLFDGVNTSMFGITAGASTWQTRAQENNFTVGQAFPSGGGTLRGGYPVGLSTDATKSGIETSDNDLYLYFYVGETVQNANLIDAGRIGEQLAGKLDSSAVKAYITETYQNGASWYRVYSDGWCEQGGHWNGTTDDTVTISFLKEFKEIPHLQMTRTMKIDSSGDTTATQVRTQSVFSITTSSFKTYGNAWGKAGVIWEASGYIK